MEKEGKEGKRCKMKDKEGKRSKKKKKERQRRQGEEAGRNRKACRLSTVEVTKGKNLKRIMVRDGICGVSVD